MSTVWIIKRGPRPNFHKAPFHPVIATGKLYLAKQEAGWSGDRAWVWSHERGTGTGGWLLERWSGLDIDYGHVVRGLDLPDGTPAAFVHDQSQEPWTLLAGAAWWDNRRPPTWLLDAGVVYPPDEFSREAILRGIDYGTDGTGGSARGLDRPEFWPEIQPGGEG